MDYRREEILQGVFLTCIHTEKFKTGTLSVSLLTQLTRETAAANAVIPYVLRRGTVTMPDLEAIAARLDGLYGARIEPCVRKKGEIQCIGFRSSFPEDAYVPEASGVLAQTASAMGELLLAPVTRGGLLLPQYVDSEREKHIERIRGRINEKRSYSVLRLCELMCPYEDYAVPAGGFEAEAENIHYHRLTQQWHELLAVSPIELFYCGGMPFEQVREALIGTFDALPRGELNFDIGTDVRMNTVEDAPRYFAESLDVTQGKLAMGYRLGEAMQEPDPAALRVFNAAFGGSVTSRLFMNVREKLSICYFASSTLDYAKGVLLVSSGIDFDKYDLARERIGSELAALARGELTDDELGAARAAVAGDLRAMEDDAAQLDEYWLSRNLEGSECSPAELAALAESVTREQIADIAAQCALDAVYFLRGRDEQDAD